jgi:hypothetical protein
MIENEAHRKVTITWTATRNGVEVGAHSSC